MSEGKTDLSALHIFGRAVPNSERDDIDRSVRLRRGQIASRARIRSVSLSLADAGAFQISLIFASVASDWAVKFARPLETRGLADIWSGQVSSLAILGLLILYFFVKGHYRERLPFRCELGELCTTSAVALLLTTAWQVLTRDGVPGPIPTGTWILLPVFCSAARQVARRILDHFGLWRLRSVVVGDAGGIATLEKIQASRSCPDFQIVTIFDPDEIRSQSSPYWRTVLEHYGAERLLLALSLGVSNRNELVQSVVRSRVPLIVISEIAELPVFGSRSIPSFPSNALLIYCGNGLCSPRARLLKTVFDFCFASAALILVAPVMLVAAILVASDGGPILFKHERIGAGGRRFKCLKFRTMVVNSQTVLRETLANNPVAAAEWVATQKLTNDPRVTKIGALLRKASLDELPQLINVLRLEMSLVGPRPIVEQEIARYSDDIIYYYETRPGLTGLWQVSGRSNTSYEQRVSYDLWYVKNWSSWNDLAILARTLPAVLSRKGAR